VAAAILGASHVVCTDGCDQVVQLAKDNIASAAKELEPDSSTTNEQQQSASTAAASEPSPIPSGGNDQNNEATTKQTTTCINNCPIDTQRMWWGKHSVETLAASDTDVVLVADCVLPKLYPIAPLVQAIDELLVKPTAMALISYEHRYYPEYDPRDKFRALATERGLVVQLVPIEEQDPIYSVEDIEVWKVFRGKL